MADDGAQNPSPWQRLGPALRRHLPNVLRLALGAFSTSTLPPGAARALDGLLGGAAGSAASSQALRQLEAQVGSSQMELESQLRLHREALTELRQGVDSVRTEIADEGRRLNKQNAELVTQVAHLRRLIVVLAVGTAIALLLLLAAVILLLRR